MEEQAFTLGAWEADGRNFINQRCIVSKQDDGHWVSIAAVFEQHDDSDKANADLMAAAPAMYRALKGMVERHAGLGCTPEVQAAFAALAKAEGR